jgi:hypothetical protein
MDHFESSLKLGLTEYEKVSHPIKYPRFRATTSVGTYGKPFNPTISQEQRGLATSTSPVSRPEAKLTPANAHPEGYSSGVLATPIGVPKASSPPLQLSEKSHLYLSLSVQSNSQPPTPLPTTRPFQSIPQSPTLPAQAPTIPAPPTSAPSSSTLIVASDAAIYLQVPTEAQDTNMQELSTASNVGKTISALQVSSNPCIQRVDCEMNDDFSARTEAPEWNAGASEDVVMSDHASSSHDTQMDIKGKGRAIHDIDMVSEDRTEIADVEMDATVEDHQVTQTPGDIPSNVHAYKAEMVVGNSMALDAVAGPDCEMDEGNELASIPSAIIVPITAGKRSSNMNS